MSEAVLRVALADDQALVRKGLRALLESLGGFMVSIEAEDGAALLAALQATAVDVILSDIRMPRHSGIEVVHLLRARGDYTPVVLLTTFDDPGLMQGAISAGAQGYLLKDAEPDALAAAIRAVAAGRSLVSPQSLDAARRVTVRDDAKPVRLTERELAVLRLVAGGYSNKEIGRALNISDGTVKNHLTEILARLDARDRTHAVLKAIAARLL
ncbi:response regulator transcription factor [Nevskia sp.]|uniref:response regulator n=1 Tax=Nevskia sp. TaxID=1929292 RepID=UPI0025E45C48|nr:response regulator transcription factor [Nevskia sp.]